jgi:PST family polysaccharide transporter
VGEDLLELKARFGKALAWSAAGQWGRQLVSFIVFGIMARVLAPADFGVVALVSAFIFLGQLFVDQGLSDAIVQRKTLETAHLDSAFWLTLMMSLALGALGLTAARPLAMAFGQPELVPVLCCMLPALPLTALASIQQAILRRSMNFRSLTIRSLAATSVGGVVGVLFAFTGGGVWALVAQAISTSAVGVIVLWTVSDWRPGFTVSRRHLKEVASFGWPIGGSSLLGFLSRRSDDIIIGFFLGPIALGYYTMAHRILELTQAAFVNITTAVSYPAFASLQSDRPRVAAVFLALTRYMSLVALPIAVGMSLMAPELIATAFGTQWVPSADVLRLLAFAVIIGAVFGFNGIVLKTMRKPGWVLRLAVLDAVANLIAFLICVRWGIVAVAAGFVVSAYVVVPLRVWLLPRVIPLKVSRFFAGFVPATVATTAMAAAILVGRYLAADTLAAPMRLTVLALLGAVTYLGVVLAIDPSLYHQGFDAVRMTLTPAKNEV